MGRLRDTHDVSAKLGIKVGGDRDARRSSDRRCPEPSCDAADAHEVRHYQVTGFHLKRPMQVPGSIKILANLNRRLQFGREPREAVKVVVNDRLLDPVEAQVIDQVTAVQCFSEIETLVVTPIADRGTNCVDGFKIIPRILPPEPKPPSSRSSVASAATNSGFLSQSPLLLYALTGPTVPPSSTQSGKPAAFASASQAAMSSPETAITARP